jgi:hypothetical protein
MLQVDPLPWVIGLYRCDLVHAGPTLRGSLRDVLKRLAQEIAQCAQLH